MVDFAKIKKNAPLALIAATVITVVGGGSGALYGAVVSVLTKSSMATCMGVGAVAVMVGALALLAIRVTGKNNGWKPSSITFLSTYSSTVIAAATIAAFIALGIIGPVGITVMTTLSVVVLLSSLRGVARQMQKESKSTTVTA